MALLSWPPDCCLLYRALTPRYLSEWTPLLTDRNHPLNLGRRPKTVLDAKAYWPSIVEVFGLSLADVLLFCLFIHKYGLFNDAASSWGGMRKLNTAQPSFSGPESLWSEISCYAVFLFTGTLDIGSQIAANKRWCYIGVSLCVRRIYFCAFAKCRKATVSFIVSVRPSAWNNSAFSGRIFIKFGFFSFSKICRENSKIEPWLQSDKNDGYFTWGPWYVYDNVVPNSP